MDALVALLPKIFCLVNRHWYGNTTRVLDTYVILIEYSCGYTHLVLKSKDGKLRGGLVPLLLK